jgi:hypothetical protein
MITDGTKGRWGNSMGRFAVELEVQNYRDVVGAAQGSLPPEKIRRQRLSGVVDSGATRLVLPESAVIALGLPAKGSVTVRFADGRRDEKPLVGDAQVEILGRSSVFTAVVESGRTDALIGAIVLEELDLIPDCTTQRLVPRYPRGIFAELDSAAQPLRR